MPSTPKNRNPKSQSDPLKSKKEEVRVERREAKKNDINKQPDKRGHKNEKIKGERWKNWGS